MRLFDALASLIFFFFRYLSNNLFFILILLHCMNRKKIMLYFQLKQAFYFDIILTDFNCITRIEWQRVQRYCYIIG